MYDIPNAAQVEGIFFDPGVDFGTPGKASLGQIIDNVNIRHLEQASKCRRHFLHLEKGGLKKRPQSVL
jgi:hypothetical protein